jgi:hypothetical protein
MSQKSSVPQAVSFVSQVLKRDTIERLRCGRADRLAEIDRFYRQDKEDRAGFENSDWLSSIFRLATIMAGIRLFGEIARNSGLN